MFQKIASLTCLFLCLSSFVFGAEKLGDGKILKSLRKSPVKSIEPMRDYLLKKQYESDFDGDVFMVELEDGTQAVYKKLEDKATDDAFGELAAYRAAQFLGFPDVAPVIFRKINGNNGTLHRYIQPSFDALAPGNYEKALNQATADEVANLKLFYFVFGQWDTGPNNLIVTQEEGKQKLYAIDNAALVMEQFAKYGDYPFVGLAFSESIPNEKEPFAPFPFDNTQVIQNPTFENVKKELAQYFPDSFLRRFTRNNYPKYYVLYQNRIWLQFFKNDPNHEPSYTTHYPEESMKKLKALDLPTLKLIFQDALDFNADFATLEYFNAILDRRDQVLQAYETHKSTLAKAAQSKPTSRLH